MTNHKYLSVNGFRNWLSTQKDISDFFNIGLDRHDENEELVGKFVKARASTKKLLEKIECDADDPEILVEEFVHNGGTILEVQDKSLLIEVESGSFLLPKFCVKLKKG